MCTLIIILENIHTSPMEGIYSKILHSPLWKFQVGLINFCIFLSHRSSHSLGNSNPFCGGSMDIFKNCTILGQNNVIPYRMCVRHGRHGGLPCELVSRSSGPGSSPGWRHCVVFLGKTLHSHSASLHPGV